MARSIIDEISSFRETFGSEEELTIEKARADYRKKVREEEDKRITENIKNQVKLENALREKGIIEGSDLWLNAMSKNQEDLAKQKQLDDMKELEEIYSYSSDLNKKLAEEKKKLNEAIVHSEVATLGEKMKASLSLAGDHIKGKLKDAAKAFGNDLNNIMETYASYQAKINARLQGSGSTFKSTENTLTGAVGLQPYIKNQSLVDNLSQLVDTGIAYNVELRAFLQTVSENIATTFSATNGTILRLIRLQQSDSTAARLGLEANLTRYFNGMYKNTEYLSKSFDDVSSAIIEAASTMSNDQSIQFEYQVQKWLGSLYSAGLSDDTVSGIAQALGYLGSGKYSALSGSPYQNLLALSAARAGLSYGDLLYSGLNESTTNLLLSSMVEYLKEISEGTNNLVKSGLAEVFGVKMSDLTAAMNLNNDAIKEIYSRTLDYSGSIGELSYQLGQLPSRIPLATMLSNVWSNLQWGLGSNIAANPALYGIWKVTSLIQDYTGGINIPAISVMGNSIDLNTTVENLVKLGVVGISSLGMIGDLISGIGNTFNPSGMLSKLGGNTLSTFKIVGGSGLTTSTAGLSSSSAVIVGNSAGSDVYESAVGGAKNEAQATADSQKSDKDMTEMTDLIQQDVSTIKEILERIDINGIRLLDLG